MLQKTPVRWGISCTILLVAIVVVYRPILSLSFQPALYPWASDTLGHVAKVDYLLRSIASGELRPSLFPGWYLGLELFRYYPPLPYYILAGIAVLVGNTVIAANWFIALCALAGALAWLPYHRWLGWPLAVTGGVLYSILPDHLRVAFAEGNLPRVLATAFLPVALFLLLRSLEEDSAVAHRVGLAAAVAAIVLSHAMMAAIYAVTLGLFAVICCFGTRAGVRRLVSSGAAMASGVLLAGWWLVPSLRGGITELNARAIADAQPIISPMQYLTPALHTQNPEAVYVGAVLLVCAAVLLFIRRGRRRHTVALTVTGLSGVIITVPGANDIFHSLPASHLFWPTRFVGIAGFLLLLALLWQMRTWSMPLLAGGVLILALVAVDSAGSFGLIHLRPLREDIVDVGSRLTEVDGWRQATLDDSRLGSAVPFVVDRQSKREQVFGWAYQGARTARNLVALNESIHAGFTEYVVDRLTLFGVDDVMLLHDMPGASRLASSLQAAGFRPIHEADTLTLYHRDGGPRAYIYTQRALAIGQGAHTFARLFPDVKVGTSVYVDDYDRNSLLAHDTLILSGFRWHEKPAAEALVRQVAEADKTVVVDLTGVPENPLARLPQFLGVWGERIVLPSEPLMVRHRDGRRDQLAFAEHGALWYTHTPQGMQVEQAEVSYLGEPASAFGYTSYGDGRVWFVGLNLAYHAARTHDRAAIELLGDVLGLSATPAPYTSIPLTEYDAGPTGYRFTYRLSTSQPLIVPIAHHAGTVVSVDGRPVRTQSIENLIVFDAPAGRHDVSIRVAPTAIHTAGWVATALGAVGLVAMAITSGHNRNSDVESGEDEDILERSV